MPATRTRKAPDPYAAIKGENAPARYLRLYAKGLSEGLEYFDHYKCIFNEQSNSTYIFQWSEDGQCWTCPCQAGASTPGNVCKHITFVYPPQPIRIPCPVCSQAMIHRQEGTEHAVRCLSCHYVEQWQDSPPSASKGADIDYQELYQIERPE